MNEFTYNLAEMLEVKPTSIQPSTLLRDIASWDSMAAVGFLALADAKYGKAVSPSALQKCITVSDLASLIGIS